MDKPILVFQSDFTYREGAVSAMYGVVKSVDRTLEIMDGTHELPHFDVWSASYRLWQTVRFWPRGTVFVSVVDPGVGTSRRASVAETDDGYYIVTPDNGTLTHIARYHGIRQVRQIDTSVNRLPSTRGTSVFHGRDVFAYTAARFAAGIIDFSGVGPAYPVSEIVSLPLPEAFGKCGSAEGIIEIVDPNFGNLWTNIEKPLFDAAGFFFGQMLRVVITHEGKTMLDISAPFGATFGAVQKGEPIVYVNELMRISCALSEGSMLETYRLDFGPDWKIAFLSEGK